MTPQKYHFNNTELTNDTILKTDKHFANICKECIDGAINKDFHVNDLDRYIQDKKRHMNNYIKGLNRNTLTYLQRAYWIQTGELIALLP